MTRYLLTAFALLSLAACDKAVPDFGGDDNRSAEGQIQQGTISDAMLPLDTTTSTPPAYKETGEPGRPDNKANAKAGDEAGVTTAQEPTPAASEPAPSASEGEG